MSQTMPVKTATLDVPGASLYYEVRGTGPVLNLFFTDYMHAIADYEPDIDALRSASCRIVPAVGEDSRGELAHTGGLGLATALGTKPAVFPGAHGGFDTHAATFAVRLREVFEN